MGFLRCMVVVWLVVPLECGRVAVSAQICGRCERGAVAVAVAVTKGEGESWEMPRKCALVGRSFSWACC